MINSMVTQKALQPHQERVVEELNELNGRIHKLLDFITDDSIFRRLPIEEQRLLSMQMSTMKAYSQVLELRIARF